MIFILNEHYFAFKDLGLPLFIYLKTNRNAMYVLAFEDQRIFITFFMFIDYVQMCDVRSLGYYFVFLVPNSRKI